MLEQTNDLIGLLYNEVKFFMLNMTLKFTLTLLKCHLTLLRQATI